MTEHILNRAVDTPHGNQPQAQAQSQPQPGKFAKGNRLSEADRKAAEAIDRKARLSEEVAGAIARTRR